MSTVEKTIEATLFIKKFFQGRKYNGETNAKYVEPENLPLWMKQSADYYRFRLGNTYIILITPKELIEFEQVVNLYRVFERMALGPGLILANDLPLKSRGLLVRLEIPHVVSNIAIYAPHLGIAYGKLKDTPKPREYKEHVSPLGLKIIAFYLLFTEDLQGFFTLSDLQLYIKKRNHNVSLSTLSRACNQLEHFEILKAKSAGRTHKLYFENRNIVWLKLLQLEIETIIKKSELTFDPRKHKNIRWVYSGDSALSMMSDLSEPKIITIATSISDFRKWMIINEKKIESHKEIIPQFIIEQWKNDPTFLAEKNCLNPIELVLSFRRNIDPRVRIALSDILKNHDLDSTFLGNLP